MIRTTRLALATSALLTLVGPLPADVFVVDAAGGGDYTALKPAVGAATAGDTLLVRAGSYVGFSTKKGVTIVADTAGQVTIIGRVSVHDVPKAQAFVLSGVRIDGDEEWPAVVDLYDNAGAVRMQGCTIQGADGEDGPVGGEPGWGQPGVSVDACMDVALTSCVVTGGAGGDTNAYYGGGYAGDGGSALEILGSPSDGPHVTVNRCILNGGNGGDARLQDSAGGGYPGSGAFVQRGRLVAIHSLMEGGDGGNGSDLIPLCTDGAAGLTVLATGEAHELGCTFIGGPGGSDAVFDDCDPGPPIEGSVSSMSGPPRAVLTERLVREGESFTLDFFGQTGDVAYLFQSAHTTERFLPFARGVYLLAPHAVKVNFIPVGTIPGSGSISMVRTAPELPLGVEDRLLHLQGYFVDTNGVPILTNMQSLVIVDDAF